ncbi:hypothetical protein [Oceanimonas smirnovii]|uniref:hypothetical protein n=1 Tax=Oceanimonas smirnovii TaxID=264574 RepID=UPI00376F8247
MGALIRLIISLLFLLFLASEVNLSTSLYRYEDNKIELTFPVWQTDNPWYYLKWDPANGVFEQRFTPKK